MHVEAGDILLVRPGNYRKILDQGPVSTTAPMTICQVACTPWFKARGIAMLGMDTSKDVRPSHYANIATPLHTVSLVALGLWLIDNANVCLDLHHPHATVVSCSRPHPSPHCETASIQLF